VIQEITMKALANANTIVLLLAAIVAGRSCAAGAAGSPVRLESPSLAVEVDRQTGEWSLLDKAAGVRWPSEGKASLGSAKGLEGGVAKAESTPKSLRLVKPNGAAVVFELTDEGRSLVLRYEGKDLGDIRALGDALAVTDQDRGSVIVPCREGLFIPATIST
jgi:hypothetical protein